MLVNKSTDIYKYVHPSVYVGAEGERENTYSAEKDEYGADHMSEIHIAGRITLNLWRILRKEVCVLCHCLP